MDIREYLINYSNFDLAILVILGMIILIVIGIVNYNKIVKKYASKRPIATLCCVVYFTVCIYIALTSYKQCKNILKLDTEMSAKFVADVEKSYGISLNLSTMKDIIACMDGAVQSSMYVYLTSNNAADTLHNGGILYLDATDMASNESIEVILDVYEYDNSTRFYTHKDGKYKPILQLAKLEDTKTQANQSKLAEKQLEMCTKFSKNLKNDYNLTIKTEDALSLISMKLTKFDLVPITVYSEDQPQTIYCMTSDKELLFDDYSELSFFTYSEKDELYKVILPE